MSAKSPYEIRLELLQLAFNILNAKAHAEYAASQTKWERNNEKLIPLTSPTTEDIITEADKMNSFISKTSAPR